MTLETVVSVLDMSVERKEVVEQRESVSGIRDDGREGDE